jgi:hypothetical protein
MTEKIMEEEAVEPQSEPIGEIIDQAIPEQETPQEEAQTQEKSDKTMIPLSVAQKLREKKRELELELQWERQERQRLMQMQQPSQKPVEDDNARYESATKEDLRSAQEEAIRAFEERQWIKQNPDLYEEVNEYLPQFLKQRPNLASAINQATNRYEEAYTLMKALSPKQQKELKASAPPKKEAPNAPTSVPKSAALNDAIDVMNMSDSEFAAWRASKRKRR